MPPNTSFEALTKMPTVQTPAVQTPAVQTPTVQAKGSRARFALVFASVFVSVVAVSGCKLTEKSEPGSAGNPIKLFFTPSVDAKVIDASSKDIEAFLEKDTGYKFDVKIPQSYIAVVEAFGSKRADVAAMNTFAYLLAHEKYGAEAKLIVIRFGKPTYQSQIVARAKDGYKSIKELAGKKFAFVDPASLSGYLLPLKSLTSAGVKVGETVFAMNHASVISMVYQGQVDAGATFYTPPQGDKIEDARRLVKTQYPDIEEKVKILQLTDEIPNDPITFRKDLPEQAKTKIAASFQKFVATSEGRQSFEKLYGVTDIKPAKDSDYDGVREMLKTLGKSAADLAK